MKQIFWIDLETTGLDTNYDQIIELSALCGKCEMHTYCLPEKKPDNYNEIEELTGISWEFLEKNGVSEQKLYTTLIEFLDFLVDKFDKTDKLIFSGYNCLFDSNFIRSLFLKYDNNYYGSYFFSPKIDVMTLVADALSKGDIPPLSNFKLSTVCEYFGIVFNAHSAHDDIHATAELYNKLQEKAHGSTWQNSAKTISFEL